MRSDPGNRNSGLQAVYMQTNDHSGNQLLAFARDAAGALDSAQTQHTGGSGDGVPHLASQGSVALTHDGRHVLVTNAGSGDLSVFGVGAGEPQAMRTVPSGSAPKSVAESDGLVYVLNTAEPSLTGFRLGDDGVEPIADSTRMLPADSDPAQVGFSPDGATLVITERGANTIAAFPVDNDGYLARPHTQPSSGPTPYGFAFTSQGALVVAEAFGAQKGEAAASSYAAHGADMQPVSRSVGNGRSEICWTAISNDDRYAFTTNFADSAVSRYAIGADATMTLDDPAAGVAIDGQSGLRDENLSGDGRFLYAIDADSQRVFGWSVGPAGALTAIGSWGGLPETVAGLAAT